MTRVSSHLLADLPEDVGQLLGSPPVSEKKLLELSVGWPALAADQARMADATRVFVITWDPLENIPSRPAGFATVNVDFPELELVVYMCSWSLIEVATKRDDTIAAVLGTMAGSAVVTAAALEESVTSGRYPRLAAYRALPDLLSDQTAGAALGPAGIRAVSTEWQDIGLGAITDTVQHAFGPVDLDRSLVELASFAERRQGCPACTGIRFGFPAGLVEARDSMCPAHRREADSLISRRLARANASNPDGWAALADATPRLERPHLPNGLAGRLLGADEAISVRANPDDLAKRAQAVIEAAGWFTGRPAELAVALGEEPEQGGRLPDWLINLVLNLGRAGLGAEAAEVGDALARVAPDQRAIFDGDVAVALAEAGHRTQATARITENLTRWPDDFWIRLHAGDALAILGDVDGAETHFRAALALAEQANDLELRYDATERLSRLQEPSDRLRQTRRPRRKLSRSQRKHKR